LPGSLKSKIFITLIVALAIGMALAIGTVRWAFQQIEAPGPLAASRVLVVPKGAGMGQIARDLETAGIIANEKLFRLYARYRKLDASLRAGEYKFEPDISMEAVLAKLAAGKTVQRFVTIPEGLTSREAAALVAAAEGMKGIADAPPEGSILPETYTFTLDENRAALIGRMRDAMKETLTELWAKRAESLPVKTPEEALVLASIVEKETGLPEERQRVAAVFVNRLNRGIPLQSDPTVAYAITKGERDLGRALRFKDLEVKDPYNTYYVAGLPPGPICNPGREAIAAVLNPIESKELYFIADGTGGHAFAETLAEHNRNVAKWRKVQKEQRRQQRLRQQNQQQNQQQ
jgi:UPF0755 protein